MIDFEISYDSHLSKVIIRKTRPVWDWERVLKWSAPETGDRCVMEVICIDGTIGL